jgi:HEAT repeat protein
VLERLDQLPADVQVAILGLVADRAALPAATAAARSGDEGVRAAALAALGRLGDAAVVPILLDAATTGAGEPQASARRGLQSLRGDPVDAALIEAVRSGPPASRAEAARVLAARGTVAAVPALLKAAADTGGAVRTEAFRALGALAGAGDLPAMVDLLVKVADDTRGAAEESLVAALRRAPDRDAAAGAVLGALPGPTPAVRSSLLRVAARTASARALDALRAALKDADETVKDAAVRALAEWPDAAAAGDLIAVARAGDRPVHKVLALRGVIRMASAPEAGAAAVKLLSDALPLCSRTEEKKLLLAALAELKDPAALDLATGVLGEKDLEVEAATAVVKIARAVQRTHAAAAAAAVRKVLDVCTTPAARQIAEGSMIVLDRLKNIAPQGTATSPDDLDKDGTAGGDQAAIDGDAGTYWDEVDGKPLYRLAVTFKQPEKVTVLSVMGYEHHRFAPKDFEVIADGKVVQSVKNAQYNDNMLVLKLGEAVGRTFELKITGYYGGSPAIRELGLYQPIDK